MTARTARPGVLVLAALLIGLLAVPAVAVPRQSEGDDPNVHLDVALVEALLSVELGEEWLEASELSRELSLVEVGGEHVEAAQALFIAQAGDLVEVEVLVELLVARERVLDNRKFRTEGIMERRKVTVAERRADLELVKLALSQAAVQSYVMGRSPAPLSVDLTTVYELATNRLIVEAAVEDMSGLKAALDARIAELEAEIAALEDELADAIIGLNLVRSQLSEHGTRLFELQEAVPESMLALRDARRLANVRGLDLSLVTVDAYLSASRQVAETHPNCGIRWQGLAGIGRVESNHGRGFGGYIDVDGRTTTTILGPVLDGETEGIAEILDSDGGALDGNGEFDRAVGPMQFLPSTWSGAGADGNGDGVADVHNLYDASLAAARYLCDRVSPLTDDALLRESYLSYNFSGEYADNVLSWAHTYDTYRLPLVPIAVPDEEPADL